MGFGKALNLQLKARKMDADNDKSNNPGKQGVPDTGLGSRPESNQVPVKIDNLKSHERTDSSEAEESRKQRVSCERSGNSLN